MEETYQTKAIILSRSPWREDGTRVVLYTQNKGKLDLIARGTRKISSKLSAHIEPITFSRIMAIHGRQYDYIGSAISDDCFFNIKTDFDKLTAAGKIINLFNRVVKEGERDENLFNLLYSTLNILNDKECSADAELLVVFFSLRLFAFLGYHPELYNCVICRDKILPGGNRFDFNKSGVVCRKHLIGLTISDNCIKVLRKVCEEDLDAVLRLKIDDNLRAEIVKIINSYLKYNQ